MSKRLYLVLVVVAAVGLIAAALAPAHKNRHRTTLNMAFVDNGMGGGGFPIDLDSPYVYCQSGRVVKFFKDGVKIDQGRTDRYGNISFGGATLEPGNYQAKSPQKRLPAALQHRPGKRHKRICKAGASRVINVS
jgi:hypothetical protein